MIPMPRFTWWLSLSVVLILSVSFGLRVGYLTRCTENGWKDTPIAVQGSVQSSQIVTSMAEHRWFGCVAPFADTEELTAHVAPGYPWMYGWIASWAESPELLMRWGQCLLAGLTPIGCFFFSRRAFRSNLAGILAGILAAVHPFWIANAAERNDGAAATFLFVASLALGARGSQTGGPFTALLFGVALGCLALVRASLLPFALIAIVWYLWECRRFTFGWFACFLALFGFINVLAPWTIRNYQVTGQPVPIVNSLYLHVWMGNNPQANGSELDEPALRKSLPPERLQAVLAESDQTRRYQMLAADCLEEIQARPKRTLVRRLEATLTFLLGERWLRQREFARIVKDGETVGAAPEWLNDEIELILHGTTVALFSLAFLGWRLSHGWRREMRIATLAMLMLPLPYILTHAEVMVGPRLPWDAVLICLAAYGLIGWLPSVSKRTKAPKSPDTQP